MKRAFESELRGFDESASRVYVYYLDEHEAEELYDMEHVEKCEHFGVFDESGYEVAPGAIYHAYSFDISDGIAVMTETVAYNV